MLLKRSLSSSMLVVLAAATISVSTTLAFSFHPFCRNHHNIYRCNPGDGEDCINKHKISIFTSKDIFGRRQQQQQQQHYHNSKLRLASFNIDLDNLDSKAQSAAEAWDVYVTPFVSSEESSEIEKRLGNRADVSCIRLGGSGGGLTSTTSTRSRFLFTNPDLGMDESTANEEYCDVLQVDNIAGLDNLDPWPNILTNIGIELNQVGDIFVSGRSNTAYLVVDPEISKVCIRLLPKELPGAVTVSSLNPEEDTFPDFEDLKLLDDMEVKRLDKREQKRK